MPALVLILVRKSQDASPVGNDGISPRKNENNGSLDLNSSSLFLLQNNNPQRLVPQIKINSFLEETTNGIKSPHIEVVAERSEKERDSLLLSPVGREPLNIQKDEEEKNESSFLNLNMSVDCIDRYSGILNNIRVSAGDISVERQSQNKDHGVADPELELIEEVQKEKDKPINLIP